MTITVTKKNIALNDNGSCMEDIVIDLHNDSNGNDLSIQTTPTDARILAEKILAALAL